ncbi:hypothetical protein Ssi02_61940 [Sinosporangium siamense]|uniref:Uncharacterized protein n=1 Tax=Sinosporangium siamense TaxID=1367973 RepID=A0A919RLV7_9ACTN|nr:hypothetical protein Ssi02_61940 [Sinosporangium siamense]
MPHPVITTAASSVSRELVVARRTPCRVRAPGRRRAGVPAPGEGPARPRVLPDAARPRVLPDLTALSGAFQAATIEKPLTALPPAEAARRTGPRPPDWGPP